MKRFIPLLALLACGDPKPPTVCGSLAQVTVNVGERAVAEPCFEDPEGGALKLSIVVADDDIAAAGLIGVRLQVTGKSPGSTTVAITATDPDSLQATQNLEVLVPNRAPTGALDDVTVRAGGDLTIDLAAHFSDPDGQDLTYTASSSQPSIVSASVAGTILTLTALGQEGSAQISVIASDGEQEVTATFMATVQVPVVLVDDDFDSDESLDDWELSDSADAEIDGGHFVLEAVNEGFWALAGQDLGGEASGGWTVDIALKTDDEEAGAGFWVETGDDDWPAYSFFVGETTIGSLGDLNFVFAWWDPNAQGGQGGWIVDNWSFGLSDDIDDLTEMVFSVTMTDGGIRGTVDGKLLFEESGADQLLDRAEIFRLATRPETEAGVTGSTNWARFTAFEFTASSPQASVRVLPDIAKLMKMPIQKK